LVYIAPREVHLKLDPRRPKIPRPPALPRIDLDPGGSGGLPPSSTDRPGFADRLAELQVRRPAIPLLITAVLTVIALLFATRLRVLTGFESLLPENRPSVKELDRVAEKTAGVSTLFIVLQGGPATPTAALRKAADALVPAVAELGPPWVGSVEDGIHESFRFLAPRAGLLIDRKKLEDVRDRIEARYVYEVDKARGTLFDDDPPPPIEPKKLRAELGLADDDVQHFPDGYYQSQDGKVVVVAIRSKVLGSDFQQGTEALRRVREVVERVRPASFDSAITWGFAGDLQTGISEYTSINNDLTEVGIFGSVLIAGVVFLYYLRFRTLFAMLITIGVGVAWTFGITQLAVGHLNMATGFLFTIIAGNGINFGVIYMARFLEARRRGASLIDGVRLAHRQTWVPTLTAAAAASASYGSLLVTEFRGFHDFGLIGGLGMILCWIATYASLPSVLTLVERLFPIDHSPLATHKPSPIARLRHLTGGGVAFGSPFAAFVPKAPRLIGLGGTALALLGIAATVHYVRSDPMEYDLRNLRNDVSARADEIRRTKLAEEITRYVGADGMAILVDRPEQVIPLRDALNAKRDAAPEGKKPFKGVHALQDFVPQDQEAKIPVLLAIKDKVLRAKKRGVLDDEAFRSIEAFLPPDDLRPFTMADLPEGLARAFTETDGTRGRIVYISPVTPESVDDAHYLLRWADSYRETKLPDGSVVKGSGRAVIYADMWAAIIDDVPPAVLFSFAATLIVVIAAFRAGRASLAVVGALLVGVGWMVGLLVAMQVKLQFLNFIALPITFGIGVDYAVNIVHRYVHEGAGGAITAVRETGGAVILCSLTTTLGYLALVRSRNYAVRSLGIAAVLGEISCLLAAVLVLPAALLWLDSHLPHGARSSLSHPPKRPR
jgi:predicted RND superfamily exporter protein